MLSVCGLGYTYRGAARKISLDHYALHSQECGLLKGASGSGKSTVLALVAGLLSAQQGQITLAGTQITGLGGAARDAYRAQHIGFVPQRSLLCKALTVEENLQLARYAAKLAPLADSALAAALEELGLLALRGQSAARLSGGEAQRLALARALVNSPKLVLADEPTANLDDANAAAALELIQSYCTKRGAALLIASHDERVFRALSDKAVVHHMGSGT